MMASDSRHGRPSRCNWTGIQILNADSGDTTFQLENELPIPGPLTAELPGRIYLSPHV